MQITLELPEDIAESLQTGWKNVERSVLEAIAINAYRSGILTRAEVAPSSRLPNYAAGGRIHDQGRGTVPLRN